MTSRPNKPWQMVALAALAAALLTWLPLLGPLGYPFRLLTTTVHELSHGLAALLTGGRFSRYVVYPDGSGLAYTAGGWRWVVIPAGYLGVTLFAAALLWVGGLKRGAQRALIVVGVAMALLSLRYSIPSIFSGDLWAGLLTLAAGVGLGVALVGLGTRASAALLIFALHLVAFQAALTALGDLWLLVGLSQGRAVQTDAHSMAELAFLPPIVWAALWGALSLFVTGWLVAARWGSR